MQTVSVVPRSTDLIAGATALAWLVAVVLGPIGWVAEQAGFIPLRLSGNAEGFVVPVLLTPISATLVHGDIIHLAMNMIMLIYCGRIVESVLGRSALACLYLVGAYAAAGAQFVVNPGSPVPMIGASGAISAIIAVYALLFSQNEVRAIGPIPSHWVRALWLAAAWTGINWLVGVTMATDGYQIATAAHVGGFLIGLAIARPLLAWRYRGA